MPAVEIPITVKPSSRAAHMTIAYDKDDKQVLLEQGQDIVLPAGHFMQGLSM